MRQFYHIFDICAQEFIKKHEFIKFIKKTEKGFTLQY